MMSLGVCYIIIKMNRLWAIRRMSIPSLAVKQDLFQTFLALNCFYQPFPYRSRTKRKN